MFPLEVRGEVNHEETRVMGLYFSEDRMIVVCVIFDIILECDGRKDRQTESIIAIGLIQRSA